MKLILGTIILLILQGCEKPETSYHFYDSHIYASFIDELNQTKIKYRKGNNYSIFYSISDESKVKAIVDMTLAKYHTGCGGTMATQDKHVALIAELTKQEIPFSIVILDKGSSISCPEIYQAAFREAMQFVYKNKGIA